jgi:hypothetical protein
LTSGRAVRYTEDRQIKRFFINVPLEVSSMRASEFKGKGSGAAYQEWVRKNPDGYVLNMKKNPSPRYLMLHNASCRMISPEKKEPACYTENDYKKVCSRSIPVLENWIKLHVAKDASPRKCGICDPH